MPKLLLLSNSTIPGQPFFGWAMSHLQTFTSQLTGYVAFVPYAAVGFGYDEYEHKVAQAWKELDIEVKSIHHAFDKKTFLKEASCIAVGGGNTFALLNLIYQEQILDTIKEQVAGGIPYIGWSAGANMACPTIKTTNDMPIVQPKSFDALGLIPFQINPHFTEAKIPGHGGEGRVERIKEFLAVNQHMPVMGLPEGMLVEQVDDKFFLKGEGVATLFRFNQEQQQLVSGSDLSTMLKPG
jgi:dipeptidase E